MLTTFCTELTGISQQQYVLGERPAHARLIFNWLKIVCTYLLQPAGLILACLFGRRSSACTAGSSSMATLNRDRTAAPSHGQVDLSAACKSVPASPTTLVASQSSILFLAACRLGPEGAARAGTALAQPCCPSIPEEVVQPEGGFQQRIWAVSAPGALAINMPCSWPVRFCIDMHLTKGMSAMERAGWAGPDGCHQWGLAATQGAGQPA